MYSEHTMADITASMVKELRELTELGMMDCKKALVEANGDIKVAEDLLRIKSGAKASKAAGRISAEGVVGVYITADRKSGALVEVNCETDFVAKNNDLINFSKDLAELVVLKNIADVESLIGTTMPRGDTVESFRKTLVMKLGENITVRRCAIHATQGNLVAYLHGTKIGVIVDYTGGDTVLGKDLAMHIAASRPVCVSREQVSADLLAHEQQIFSAQAKESGKPDNIIEKMVAGRIAKYLAEVTLLGQSFIKDTGQTIEELLATKSAKVNKFSVFVVGEGIEKKVDNFVNEVTSQLGELTS